MNRVWTAMYYLFQKPFPHHHPRGVVPKPPDIQNPVYESEGFLRNRVPVDHQVRDRSQHICDGAACMVLERETATEKPNDSSLQAQPDTEPISGLIYSCMDCDPGSIDFCSECVRLPGQGIDHDTSHRLLQTATTVCSVCLNLDGGMDQIKDKGDRGTYTELNTEYATLREITNVGQCGFCRFVWTALEQCYGSGRENFWPPKDEDILKIRVRWRWRNCFSVSLVSNGDEHEIEVYAFMNWIRNLIPSRPRTQSVGKRGKPRPRTIEMAQRSSGSDQALKLARRWLQTCLEEHTECRGKLAQEHRLRPPTRLLDLEGPDSTRVYLHRTNGKNSSYAALSYCWGPGAPGLCTESSTLQTHQEDGLLIEDLPNTLKDAIRATKALGLRYLWIDRLCIIQDSAEDWAREAGLMCDVYSGAEVTLCADWSTTATEGLFYPEQGLSDLDYEPYNPPEDTKFIPLFLRKIDHHSTHNVNLFNSTLPIETRGWTLQEGLMSQRLIHFTRQEMVWVCNGLTECECCRQSSTVVREIMPERMNSKTSIYARWSWVARQYSERSLSNQTDRLPALQGIVTRFQLALQNMNSDGKHQDEYIAGHWKSNLAVELAWKPVATLLLRLSAGRKLAWSDYLQECIERLGSVQGPDVYIAPTWSWLSYDGQLSHLVAQPYLPFTSYIDILESRARPLNRRYPTGRIIWASLTLRGYIVQGLNLHPISYSSDEDIRAGQMDYLYQLETKDGEIEFQFPCDNENTLLRQSPYLTGKAAILLLGTSDAHPEYLNQLNRDDEGLDYFENIVAEAAPRINRRGVQTGRGDLPLALKEVFQPVGSSIEKRSSYLVLAETKHQEGAYVRIGCFDVCDRRHQEGVGFSYESQCLMDIFKHAVMEKVTII